jgi:hypothetical protein
MRLAHTTPLLLAFGMLLAGCAGAAHAPKEDPPYKGAPAASSLMLDGQAVGAAGTRPRSTRAATPAGAIAALGTPLPKKWPVPALLSDGSLDAGADPFAGESVPVQPLPIEDDATATRTIDDWSTALKNIDPAQWSKWTAAAQRSPWQQDVDARLKSMVKVSVERCGGAQTVASGVVLGAETVVTTVHAIESADQRVRISPAGDDTTRLAAIVRYMDIDNDIAVLKVPGLKAPAMDFHTAGSTAYEWGYAYGVTQDGLSGTLNRTPAIVSTQEEDLTVEQPDGFAQQIKDRQVLTAVAAVDSGYSGGAMVATTDPNGVTGFGFAGLVRARVPYRSNTGAIVIPPRLVRTALTAAAALDPWFEHVPNRCPQWHR